MQQPDAVVARTPMADLEDKMGIPPLEGLLAERDELVRTAARLRARHGAFGTWEAERKIELAKAATIIRAHAIQRETKVTEKAIEDAAHMAPTYVEFVAASVSEKADWFIAENKIQGIADTIFRGNAIARYLASEAQL